jgi:aspartate carbamoyltransferase catalytic subunit
MPDADEFPGTALRVPDAGIAHADVVMMLRIQRERIAATPQPDLARYQ